MAKSFEFVQPRGLTSPLTKLDIVIDPDPRLRKIPPEVERFDNELRATIDNMKNLMIELDAVGLAANQVGINQRIALASDEEGNIIAAVNLKIMEGWGNRFVPEGCLSLPGIEIMKRRPIRVYAGWKNEYGLNIHKHAEGLLAQVLCHEADHLDGRLMTDEDDRKWHEIYGGV